MSPPPQVIALSLLAAAGGSLLGCGSSSSGRALSGPDASADTSPSDAGADGSADARSGDAGTAVEAGSPCTSNADCDLGHGLLCGFPTDGGCTASGICIEVSAGGCACDAGGALVCSCAGDLVTPSCCYPQGYQPFPLAPSDSCVADSGADQGTDAGAGGGTDAGAE